MTTQQTELNLGLKESGTAKNEDSYRVPKYRVQYVRERNNEDLVTITRCNQAREFFCKQFDGLPLEQVAVLALDAGSRILGYDLFEGDTNQCAIYPQKVFRFLLSICATSFIVGHNHPGGTLVPSEGDWKITKLLQRTGQLLRLPLNDHVIVADGNTVCMRDMASWSH